MLDLTRNREWLRTKRTVCIGLLSLFSLLGCGDDDSVYGADAGPDASTQDLERERAATLPVEAFFAAFNAHSFAQAADFTTEDWNHVTPRGVWLRGRPEVITQLGFVHEMTLQGSRSQLQGVRVRFLAPDVAVIVTTSMLSPNGPPNQTRASFVVVKRGEQWLLMHDHHTWIAALGFGDSVGVPIAAPAVQSEPERAVRAFMVAYVANTLAHKDPSAIWTEDTNFINPTGGWSRDRASVVAEQQAVGSTFLKDTVETILEMTVRFAAEGIAVVTVDSSNTPWTGPDGVLRKHPRGRTTYVLVNQDGRWLLAHAQLTGVSA